MCFEGEREGRGVGRGGEKRRVEEIKKGGEIGRERSKREHKVPLINQTLLGE